jgi:dTDP-4-amino-4,6-dideoxygalactose transaminase
MVPAERDQLEDWLAERYGRNHCVLVGRATTGIALALQATDVSGEVLVPTYTCASPAYAVTYADATPTFVDVDHDYTLSVDSVREQISDETEAVIAIHLFGHAAEIDTLQDVCHEHECLLVEDACQSLGTTYQGQRTGTFGDVSVLSFGHKKHIDADGGGAVLTDDEAVAAGIREAAADIPIRDADRLETLYDHYRDIYYAIEDLTAIHPPAKQLYEPFPRVFRELYLRGFDPDVTAAIADGYESLAEAVATRRRHADRYHDGLDHPRITRPDPRGIPSYSRYSIRFDTTTLRDHVVESLRDDDFHVSTLYSPIHERFGDSSAYPVATDLASQTINLWVTPRVDRTYVYNCIDAVITSVTEFEDE